jgi:hypothetical protein
MRHSLTRDMHLAYDARCTVRLSHGDLAYRQVGDDKHFLRDGLDDFMHMDAKAADLTVKEWLEWETPQKDFS